ncbi:hypothetical protein [Streptomyces sp. T028]|uniref:hypothetical protein n=1 Tax=Streptomyces sp. T028 TaxID=3394379 RepID=UPI003A85A2F9
MTEPYVIELEPEVRDWPNFSRGLRRPWASRTLVTWEREYASCGSFWADVPRE